MKLRSLQRLDYVIGGMGLVILRPLVRVLGRLVRRDHRPEPQGSIGVLKLIGGGSLLLAAPALLGLRRHYPDRRLVLISTPGTVSFARSLGVFDDFVVIDTKSGWSLVRTSTHALLRAGGLDTVLDLEPYSRLTTVFSTLSLARNRVGFFLDSTFWREGVLTHLVFFNRNAPVGLLYDAIVRVVGAKPAPRGDVARAVASWAGTTVVSQGQVGRESPGWRLCLAPACSSFGRERMLSPAQWMRVLETCRDPAVHTIAVVGGAADAPVAEGIIRAGREQLPAVTWINACDGRSLMDSVRLIADSDYFVGVDSGLLHFARVLGVPARSVWGPTNPRTRLRDAGTEWDLAYYAQTACSPCIHVAETAPCGGANLCIEAAVITARDPKAGEAFAAGVAVPTFRTRPGRPDEPSDEDGQPALQAREG